MRSKADIEANLPGYSCTTFLQPGAWGATPASSDHLHANIDMYPELEMPVGQAIAANYQQSMACLGSGWRIGDSYHRHGTTNIFSIDYQSHPTVQSINATLDVVAGTPGLIFIVSCHGVQETSGTAAYNTQADILKAFMDKAADLRDQGKVRLMGLHDAFHTDFSDDLNLVPDPGFELCQPGWLNPVGPWQLLRSAVISPDEGVGGSRCLKLTGPGARAQSYAWLLRPGTYDLSWQQNVGFEAPNTSTFPSVGNLSSTASGDSRGIVYYPQIVSQEPGIWRTKTVRLLIKEGRPLALFRIELPGNASQFANVRFDDISLVRVPTDPAVEPNAVTISPEPTTCTVSWLTPDDPTVTSIVCRYGFNTHPLSTTDGASGGSIQAVPGTRQQLSFPINWTGRYAVFLSLFAARDGVVSGPVVDYLIVDGSGPSLNDPIVTAQSDSSILASWQSSDAQSSVFDSWFAVGRSEGSSDVVGWTSTRSCSVEIDHLPTGTLHFSVYTRNPFGAKSVTKSVRFVMGTAQTIAYARSQPDGSWVPVRGVVTAIFADRYYIESANRANGIRVGGVCPVEMGSEIVVPGTLTTIDGERAVVPD